MRCESAFTIAYAPVVHQMLQSCSYQPLCLLRASSAALPCPCPLTCASCSCNCLALRYRRVSGPKLSLQATTQATAIGTRYAPENSRCSVLPCCSLAEACTQSVSQHSQNASWCNVALKARVPSTGMTWHAVPCASTEASLHQPARHVALTSAARLSGNLALPCRPAHPHPHGAQSQKQLQAR